MNKKVVLDINKKQEQLKGFISGIKILATKYNINQDDVLNAAVEAITKGYKHEYLMEPKIELQINNQKLIVLTYQKVVENDDDVEHDAHITLANAKKIKPDVLVGDFILMKNAPEVDFSKWSYKTINIFNQLLIQKCKEISRQNIIKNYSSKVGTLVKGIVEGVNNSNTGYIIRLFDNNLAFLPKYLCSPKDNIKIAQNNHIKFLVHSVSDLESRYKDYSIILSRNTEKFVVELFNEIIPEIKDNLIKIQYASRVAGVKTKIIAESFNQYIHVVGAFIGPNEERINVIRKEIANERIEIVQLIPNKNELIKKVINHIEPIFIAKGELFNEKKQINVPTKFLVLKEEDLGKAVGPRWINIQILKKIFNENWSAITLADAEAKNLKPIKEIPAVAKETNDLSIIFFGVDKAPLNNQTNKTSDNKVNASNENMEVKVEKIKKINFKDIPINTNSTMAKPSISLESQLEDNKKHSHSKTNNKFTKYNNKFKPKNNKDEISLEEIAKQNEILNQKWAQNNVDVVNDNYDIDEDFDENIDLNDDYNDLYD